MQTLLLDLTTWDLVIDAQGNIAVASNPYSLAQDAASGGRTFLGEVYYDTTLGIPYFEDILGKFPLTLYKAKLVAEAMRVPEIVAARVFFDDFTKESKMVNGVFVQGRRLTGQMQVTDTTGVISALSI